MKASLHGNFRGMLPSTHFAGQATVIRSTASANPSEAIGRALTSRATLQQSGYSDSASKTNSFCRSEFEGRAALSGIGESTRSYYSGAEVGRISGRNLIETIRERDHAIGALQGAFLQYSADGRITHGEGAQLGSMLAAVMQLDAEVLRGLARNPEVRSWIEKPEVMYGQAPQPQDDRVYAGGSPNFDEAAARNPESRSWIEKPEVMYGQAPQPQDDRVYAGGSPNFDEAAARNPEARSWIEKPEVMYGQAPQPQDDRVYAGGSPNFDEAAARNPEARSWIEKPEVMYGQAPQSRDAGYAGIEKPEVMYGQAPQPSDGRVYAGGTPNFDELRPS